MPTRLITAGGLCLVALLCLATRAGAQDEPLAPYWTYSETRRPHILPAGALLADSSSLSAQASQSPDSPAVPPWSAERRACEGCPRRSVGRAFAAATVVNGFYEVANLVRGQVTAKITPKTWWANMKQGWVWDLDDFLVNQFGHPYQGSNYFNAGRANGLTFWESAGITAFGSGTWEYFGETNNASVNDLINTTLGGIALGEMFHRTAWLVRDTRATGSPRLMKEIAAAAIDPLTGINRFISGDSSRLSDKPADMVPSSLSGMTYAGVLWRGSNTNAFNSTGQPFLEVDLMYGDLARDRSRTPFDAFAVLLRLGGGSGVSEFKVRGRLLGEPFRGNRLQLNVAQNYDYNKNNVYQFGAQSFTVNGTFSGRLPARMSLQLQGWGGLTALGAVDSIPLTGIAPEEDPPPGEEPGQGVSEGPRYYDYGPGSNYGVSAFLRRDGRTLAQFLYDAHQIYSLDGVRANHFLQQLRLDVLAPLRGSFGIGASGEYFDRRTYFQDAANTTQKYHFPQARFYITWKIS